VTSAVCFDLNGTLSLDEELMYEMLAEILAERGRALPRGVYFREFVGLADEEIAASWLGSPDAEAREIAGERSRRFRALPLENRNPEAAADALRVAAARVPVAIVTSSLRAEVEPLLAVAGLTGLVAVTVAGDDVSRPKPDAEPYRRALEALGVADALAFEDTPAGIASAKAAGLRCCAVATTVAREQLAEADVIADALTPGLVESLLGPEPG
jgi:beta-phosphoglucomutase